MSRSRSVSERLADFCVGLQAGDFPAYVVEDARWRLVDTIGCAAAGARLEHARAVGEVAFEQGGATESTVIGSDRRLPAPLAGFLNTIYAHGPDYDDTHSVAMVHMSAVAVISTLVMGEREGIDGSRFLTAMVAGAELGVRVAALVPHIFHKHNFHATGIVGPFCSATIGSLVLGLDAERLANALGVAGSLAAGLRQGNLDGSWVKRVHPAWGVQNGLLAALFCERGFTGPREIFEGPWGLYKVYLHREPGIDPERLLEGLGADWLYPQSTYKPFPNGAWNHASMDAVAIAMRQGGIGFENVERVDVRVPPQCIPIVCEPRPARLSPASPYHMKFSLQYSVAMLAVLGHAGVDDYSAEVLANRRIADFAARVFCEGDESMSPEGFPAQVVVHTRDGRQLTCDMPAQRGGPGNPKSPDDHRAKFRANASGTLGEARSEQLLAALESLWDAPDLSAVTSAMTS